MRELQEKCIEKFGPKAWTEENIWATFLIILKWILN